MEKMKKIAVIGAGAAGLAATKSCLEETFHVTCYERRDDIGGLWRYQPQVVEGHSSVMQSTVMNTSKEITAFSDFPPPSHFPNYMHHRDVIQYFRMYAENFEILKHVRFRHDVLQISKSDDFVETGKWKIRIRDLESDTDSEDIVDGVMVCTGHHAFPTMAEYPGLDVFRGQVIHSHSYRTPDHYQDKNVLVIGLGNSGCDVVVEIGVVANRVFLSTRRGGWVIERKGPFGMPLDYYVVNRFSDLLRRMFPRLTRFFLELYINFSFNHKIHNLNPNHSIFSQHPTINDFLCFRVLTGTVRIKRDIKYFTESGVVFEEEDTVHPIDAIIMATGYDAKLPFLQMDLHGQNGLELYKFIFPPALEHPSLAFIGIVETFGALFPLMEMQSRWFVQLMSGRRCLPSKQEMLRDIQRKRELNNKIYMTGNRHENLVISVPYVDHIAEQFGAKPNLLKMLLADARLFWTCFSGPCVAYQYRLQGPNSWSGARDAIMTVDERMGLSTSTSSQSSSTKSWPGRAQSTTKFMFFIFFSILALFVSPLLIW